MSQAQVEISKDNVVIDKESIGELMGQAKHVVAIPIGDESMAQQIVRELGLDGANQKDSRVAVLQAKIDKSLATFPQTPRS